MTDADYDAYARAQSTLYWRTLSVERNRRGWDEAGCLARAWARCCLCESVEPKPVELSGVICMAQAPAPAAPLAHEMARGM